MNATVEISEMEHALWDVRDVARFLKMSASWVYHASERGEIPHVRIGASLRFEPAAVREWLRNRSRRGVSLVPATITGV